MSIKPSPTIHTKQTCLHFPGKLNQVDAAEEDVVVDEVEDVEEDVVEEEQDAEQDVVVDQALVAVVVAVDFLAGKDGLTTIISKETSVHVQMRRVEPRPIDRVDSKTRLAEICKRVCDVSNISALSRQTKRWHSTLRGSSSSKREKFLTSSSQQEQLTTTRTRSSSMHAFDVVISSLR